MSNRTLRAQANNGGCVGDGNQARRSLNRGVVWLKDDRPVVLLTLARAVVPPPRLRAFPLDFDAADARSGELPCGGLMRYLGRPS